MPASEGKAEACVGSRGGRWCFWIWTPTWLPGWTAASAPLRSYLNWEVFSFLRPFGT